MRIMGHGVQTPKFRDRRSDVKASSGNDRISRTIRFSYMVLLVIFTGFIGSILFGAESFGFNCFVEI